MHYATESMYTHLHPIHCLPLSLSFLNAQACASSNIQNDMKQEDKQDVNMIE